MSTISPSVRNLIGLLVVVVGASLYLQGQADPAKKTTLSVATRRDAPKSTEFTAEDYSAHFAPPSVKSGLRNIFAPLVKNDNGVSTVSQPGSSDIIHVPANFAGGDANWIFTGYAVVNGEKSALLENRTTHLSEFVKEGASWKTSRIERINPGSVVFADADGGKVPVMRFDPLLASKSDAKSGPDLGLKPLDPTPALQGAIGPIPPSAPPGLMGRRVFRGGAFPPGAVIVSGG
jgi:hypothetical protein